MTAQAHETTGKSIIRPSLRRSPGLYHCPYCDRRAEYAGQCPDDGIPLRKLSRSKT